MSAGDPGKSALQARLEWLRLMGVDAIRRPAGTPRPATRAAGEGPGAGAPAGEPAGPPRLERSAPSLSPLLASGAMATGPGSIASMQGGLFGETPGADSVSWPDAGAAAATGGRSEKTPPATRGAEPRIASPLVEALAGEAAPAADPAAALAALREEIGDCRRCRLCEKRTNVVFGVGSPKARVMFVGEGPGADEDAQGEPFVGRAGQLLTRIIEAMGLTRADVYIANIVKCRPPENRTPLPDEVGTCSPFLFRQIAAIRPEVIVCLGTPSAQTLLGTRETITRMRGTFREVAGVRVMPTFHPAYLLRNPAAKREVWEDMKQVMAVLKPSA